MGDAVVDADAVAEINFEVYFYKRVEFITSALFLFY